MMGIFKPEKKTNHLYFGEALIRISLMPSGSTGTISGDLIIYAPNVTLTLDGLTIVGNTVIE